VATSFVKTIDDIHRLKKAIQDSLGNIKNYFPKIIAKIEMAEAIEPTNITDIINECYMIMIARGDLALETTPVHIRVPFIQADLVQRCQKHNKPFIVATQILESMITCPVPTRAEVSDLYRAVVLDKANYVMLSGEAAVGQYPKECVTLMHDLIHYNKVQSVNPNRKRTSETTEKRSIKKIKTRNQSKKKSNFPISKNINSNQSKTLS
jgi:pyruvate kinase